MSEIANYKIDIAGIIVHDPRGDYSIYPTATVRERLFANILDSFLLGSISQTVGILITVLAGPSLGLMYSTYFSLIAQLIVFAACFVYPLHKYGATIGLKLFDLQVVYTENSEQLSIFTVIMREILKLVGFIFLGFGAIMVLLRQDKRAFHDVICKTRVISKKN